MALTKITSRILDSSGVTILGTIATGVWQGTAINQAYLVGQSGTNTGDETLARINALDITELGTVSSGVWNGTVIASAYLDADTAHLSTTQTFTGTKTFSANVGIGTTSPTQSRLVVIDSTDTSKQIVFSNNATYYGSISHNAQTGKNEYRTESGGGHSFYQGTSSSSQLTISPGGNVGIGVSPENSTGTWRNLQFGGGNIVFRSSGNNGAFFGTNYLFKTDNSEVYKDSAATSRIYFDGDVIKIQHSASGTAGSSIVYTNPLTILSGGNVDFKSHISINSASGAAGSQGGITINQSPQNSASRNWKIWADDAAWGDFNIKVATAYNGSTYTTPLNISSVGVATFQLSALTNPSGVDSNTGVIIKNNGWSGITLLSSAATGSFLTFGDSDAGFRGRIQYLHGSTDAMVFETAAAERFRITSEGIAKIYAQDPFALRVVAKDTIGDAAIGFYRSGESYRKANIGFINGTDNTFYLGNRENADMLFHTNDAERMRISSGGNVGIGNTNPSVPLDITSNSGANALRIRARTANDYGFISFYNNAGTAYWGEIYYFGSATAGSSLIFTVGSSTPKLTISSGGAATFSGTVTSTSGFLGNATTSSRFKSTSQSSATATNANLLYTGIHMNYYSGGAVTNTASGGYGTVISFGGADGGVAGSLQMQAVLNHNTSTAATNSLYYRIGNNLGYSNDWKAFTYSSVSDYRLKENIKPMNSVIDRIKSMNAVSFNFINEPDKEVEGFIAHEVQEIIPEAVLNEKDKVGSNGTPMYQSIDYSKITPFLIKAIQEQQTQIELLKQEVESLKQ